MAVVGPCWSWGLSHVDFHFNKPPLTAPPSRGAARERRPPSSRSGARASRAVLAGAWRRGPALGGG
eukprot:3043133-Prymnesium_polylepis.1